MSDVSATLAERGGRYGAFIDHATIAQGLQEVLFEAGNWYKLDPDMRQALCVICDKMARILNGDPYYEDNWHDIQGYAQLVEKRIRAIKQNNEEKEAKKGHEASPFPPQIYGKEIRPHPNKPLGWFEDEDGNEWHLPEDITKKMTKPESGCRGKAFGENYTG